MQHLDEGTIHSWLDGALSADEGARVDAHVKECPQCAAAVAEARGFIAASSRILTSLDNVPKGVVPAVPLSKPRNWGVWRAAAAVIVVALGSFVVLRDRTATPDQTTPASAVALQTDTGGATQTGSEPAETTAPAAARKAAPIRTFQRALLPPAATTQLGKASAGSAKTREILGDNAAPPRPAGAFGAAASESSVPSLAVAGVTVMDATEPQPVRVVGTPRVIGENRTLYEVAPGDTVLLAEVTSTNLNAAVLTGAAAAAQRDTPSSGMRQDASKIQTAHEAPPRLQPVPSVATLSAPPVQAADGITTIVWRDPATGNTMRLSGRHSPSALLAIRLRIERMRAAEAAKKKP